MLLSFVIVMISRHDSFHTIITITITIMIILMAMTRMMVIMKCHLQSHCPIMNHWHPLCNFKPTIVTTITTITPLLYSYQWYSTRKYINNMNNHNNISVEDFIYNHALMCGRDGAVKQWLGQYGAAKAC